MKRAVCMIREAPVYRRTAFVTGLRAAGYAVVGKLDKPDAGDLLVIWNRYGQGEETAQQFERVRAPVVVVENGYLGNGWLGDRWFSAALSQHGGAGTWPVGGNERWDSLGVTLEPWRVSGKERIILAQRSIGSSLVRSPPEWAHRVRGRVGGRVRMHPGNEPAKVPLIEDLKNAASVVTWASSAALLALMFGVPVWYDFPQWIGALAGRPLSEFHGPGGTLAPVKRSDADRLLMFRRLIWAMWRASEIEDGTAFRHLLQEEEKVAA